MAEEQEFNVTYFDIELGESVTRPMTDEEVADMMAAREEHSKDLSLVRMERNILLSQSDWTQMPDSPLSDEKKTEWATYRQELRDLLASGTLITDFPMPDCFPTQPE